MRRPGSPLLEGAVFRVRDGASVAWVAAEPSPDGKWTLRCTCPLREGCGHVGAVEERLARFAAGGDGAREEEARGPRAEASDSFPSVEVASAPPPGPSPRTDRPRRALLSGESALERQARRWRGVYDDPASLARVTRAMRRAATSLAVRGAGADAAEPRAAVEEAIVELAGLVMTDALKAVADLRRCLADGAPSPAAFATAFQRFLGVLGVLETHAAGGKVDERLHATYLGRRWGMHETGQKEDVRLVELARTSFRTPPDMRISESFYMNAATGHLFVEEHYHLPGEGGFSVGPFPRMLAVNLMTVEPRVHPGAVTLMQYAVAGPPTESDLLQVKKMALDSVGGAVKLYRRVVKTARCPYPVFAVVAPVATSTAGGNVTMQDAEGAAIPLAREASPADCHAAAQICGAGRLHAACGHLVLEEGRLALVPLSLLVEEDASLRLARIR